MLAKDTPISLKYFQAQLLGAEAYIESKITSLSTTMSAMCVQGDPNSSLRYQGGYQGYEQGESSATNRSQGEVHFGGGSGYVRNGGKSFQSQQRNNYNNYNNRRYSGHHNNNFISYSNFGDKPGSSTLDRGDDSNNKGSSNSFGGNGLNGSFSGNVSRPSGWQGNTNYRSLVSP